MKPIKQAINTIPEGTWEAGQTNESLQNANKNSLASELKKDGYPVKATDESEKTVRILEDGMDGK